MSNEFPHIERALEGIRKFAPDEQRILIRESKQMIFERWIAERITTEERMHLLRILSRMEGEL